MVEGELMGKPTLVSMYQARAVSALALKFALKAWLLTLFQLLRLKNSEPPNRQAVQCRTPAAQ